MTAPTADTITAGSIWVKGRTHLPASLLLQSESDCNGWSAIRDTRFTFEKTIQDAGWTLFFMAGEIKATVYGSDRQKALRAAMKRLTEDVTSQHCNSIEITRVTAKSFLGMPYLNVFAHARHVQKDVVFSPAGVGLDRPDFSPSPKSKWRVTVS
jgi:hypothetical protein